MSIAIRNPVARRKAIQQELVLRGTASVRELSQLLGVSSPTIRRDLESLQRDSLLKRTFGGAEVCNTRYVELAFADREKQNLEGKQAIAKMAIKLLRPHYTVFLNDGSTMLALAREIIASDLELFIITPALNLANLLVESPHLTVYLTGGLVRRKTLSVSGPHAEALVERFNADIALVSADGFSVDQGLSYIDPSDAELANRLVHRAKKSVALVTSDKLGASARVTAVSVSDVDLLITDKIDRQLKNRFDACGLEVTVALGRE
jgi:DeoR/GlpR family transcriptional regulator of sugar metabolism